MRAKNPIHILHAGYQLFFAESTQHFVLLRDCNKHIFGIRHLQNSFLKKLYTILWYYILYSGIIYCTLVLYTVLWYYILYSGILELGNCSDLPDLFTNLADFSGNFCGITALKTWRILSSLHIRPYL